METSMKYSLNPLAACFVPLSMKANTGNANEDVHSTELNKFIPISTSEQRASSFNKANTDYLEVRNLDLIGELTTFEDFSFTSEKPEVNESVYTKETSDKISDEASIDRSKDGTYIEKVDFMEHKDMTGNGSMELKLTSNIVYEIERTSNMDEITDPIKMNLTSNMALENADSEIIQVGSVSAILEQGNSLADYENISGQHKSTSSIESVHSTGSFKSDYGTDIENMETADCSDLPTEVQSDVKSQSTVENEETTLELVSGNSESDFNLQTKKSNTLNSYLTIMLTSVLSSKNGEAKTCSKEILKARYKRKEECNCPPMFGWIVPFDFFGNPFNLTGTCNKHYVHTTYEHSIYDKYSVPSIYRKPLYFENNSIDSGHCSEEDEPSGSVDEVNTLEQCSSELESIIKDVFDCVDQSLSSCEDVKDHTTDKNSEVWLTAKEMKVQDSPIIDDGYHPLLKEITSEEVDKDISVIEKFLGEAFTFGAKYVDENQSQSSCILPCSVWCTNVPPPVIDTYKRFVKKSDSKPANSNGADKNNVLRKRIYKRCFSANDAPKNFDYDAVLRLASSFEPKTQCYQQDLAVFKDSKGADGKNVPHSFVSELQTNLSKEGSDTWSLYDGADSMWQPLPDCVLSTDHSQKYAYKKARVMRRQKSVS